MLLFLLGPCREIKMKSFWLSVFVLCLLNFCNGTVMENMKKPGIELTIPQPLEANNLDNVQSDVATLIGRNLRQDSAVKQVEQKEEPVKNFRTGRFFFPQRNSHENHGNYHHDNYHHPNVPNHNHWRRNNRNENQHWKPSMGVKYKWKYYPKASYKSYENKFNQHWNKKFKEIKYVVDSVLHHFG